MGWISNIARARITLIISIPPELDVFLQGGVQSVRYQTTSEVDVDVFRLLERRKREGCETFLLLKAKLQRGAAEADRGELFYCDENFARMKTGGWGWGEFPVAEQAGRAGVWRAVVEGGQTQLSGSVPAGSRDLDIEEVVDK